MLTVRPCLDLDRLRLLLLQRLSFLGEQGREITRRTLVGVATSTLPKNIRGVGKRGSYNGRRSAWEGTLLPPG